MLLVLLIIEHLTSLRSLITTAVVTSSIGAALCVANYHFKPKKRKLCFMYIANIFVGAFYGWGAGFLLFFGVAGLYAPIHIFRNSVVTVN
mmetsp:Transcript_16857/g.23596  ORF Transcript_16857/g.23596 Transcript_16857/m.23596 type:complete len:90 (+) Transcript_16857:315-584(+)